MTFSKRLLSNSLPPGKNVRSNIINFPPREMICGHGHEKNSDISTPGTARKFKCPTPGPKRSIKIPPYAPPPPPPLSDNPFVYKHGQADGSSIQTSYCDSPSCQTNYHGELVKTDDPSLCINAGRRRTIHKNYTSLQEVSCCFQSHDTPIVRLIALPLFILDG